MKNQYIGLLSTVISAISDLADAGDGVNVAVHTIVTTFPDNSTVTFTADRETPETDWFITMGGPGGA